MYKFFARAGVALAAIAITWAPATARAGELKLTIHDGLVTLMAQDVPVRQILAEWARLGQTTIVNADKLTGPPLTLQLVDRPEREVLDVVLRSASGYIAAQRPTLLANASQFDRVMILPVSHGPVGVAAAPPPPQFGPGAAIWGRRCSCRHRSPTRTNRWIRMCRPISRWSRSRARRSRTRRLRTASRASSRR